MAVNENNVFHYQPQINKLSDAVAQGVDPDSVRIIYNDAADELVVFILSDVDHTVAIESGDNVYLLLDPVTEEAVGFQFDDFMNVVALQRPRLLALASLADVNPDLIEQARQRIGTERARRALVQSALRDLLEEAPIQT